jgi:hypothetical protein
MCACRTELMLGGAGMHHMLRAAPPPGPAAAATHQPLCAVWAARVVAQDLLPILEGSVVPTKYGNVSTDHVLFIASGAFHSSKPSDMLAELQVRLWGAGRVVHGRLDAHASCVCSLNGAETTPAHTAAAYRPTARRNAGPPAGACGAGGPDC